MVLAGLLSITACGEDEAKHGSLSIPVDPSAAPAQEKIGERPVGRMTSERGVATDFYLGELLVSSDDKAKVESFAARWGGSIIASTSRIGDTPAFHKVKLDPSRAKVDELLAELNAKAPELAGKFRASSDDAAKLLAVALVEANRGGMSVSPNFVVAPQAIADGATSEAATGPDGYDRNAFNWPYMNRGSAQDVGVGAAWQIMQRAGVLGNKVRMMILDGGFAPSADFPADRAVVGDWNRSNPGSCGGGPCPWHGTEVTSAAMGTVDDGMGTAGPAGPVARLIAVPFQLELFELITTIERVFLGAAAADIINISAGFELDIGWDIAVKVACLGLCPSPSEMAGGVFATVAASNKLIFASAGNSSKDVDVPHPLGESSTHIPCELPGVICVGGMATDSTALDPGSNFGSRDDDDSVDIYGPYSVFVGPTPEAPADSARMKSGTSFSSPFVAGVAALVWASDPRQSAQDVWRVMRETAHAGGVHGMGRGHQRRVNAHGAVARVLGGARPTVALNAVGATAPLGREWSVVAQVGDDGATCPPARCPIEWSPTPSRVAGNVAFYRFDTAGSKTVTATASDPTGQTATATRDVDVVNSPPTVVISAPANDATIPQGVAAQLLGSATDVNDGPDPGPASLSCTWTSSNPADDAFPVTSCNVTRTFGTQGPRTLTLTATDAQGQTTSASVNVVVAAPPVNYPPITSSTTTLPPINYDGQGYVWTTPLSLSATATDPESNNPITYEWRATSFRPNSTTPFASNVTIGSSASFTWTPSSANPAMFGDFATFGNDCYHGQTVRISVRARDSLGNTSNPVNLPDIKVYRCILE